MKVWLIQTGEPVPLTPDVKRMRTALLAEELASRGHDVVWWASSFDHGSRRFVAPGGSVERIGERIEARLLPAFGYRSNMSLSRYLDHKRVARGFRRTSGWDSDRPDLVVAATPDYHIGADAAEYAQRRGIPYVVDVRDPWPESFTDLVPTRMGRRIAGLLLTRDFAKVRRMTRGAAGIVGMMESMLEWGLAQAGRARGPTDRVFYLGTEPLPAPDPAFLISLKRQLPTDGRPFVVYVGTFGRYNHPGVIVDAFRSLRAGGRDPGFDVIIGGAGELFATIERQAKSLPGVHLTGWLQPEQIAAVLSLGSVGVVPWTKGHAFPNKAFSYFAAGLPVLTSAAGDLERILRAEEIGDFYPPGNSHTLASRLRDLLHDPGALAAMRSRVRELYRRRFLADGIYRDYADYLEGIVRSSRPKPACGPS